jgi:hypothetical protein
MRGKLPPSIDNVLSENDLNYFEFFFHGSHVDNQDEANFELLSVRSEPGKQSLIFAHVKRLAFSWSQQLP